MTWRNDMQLEVYSVKMKRLFNNACADDAKGASSQSNFIRLHSDSAMAMGHRQLNLLFARAKTTSRQ
jgi:hypothetical protein